MIRRYCLLPVMILAVLSLLIYGATVADDAGKSSDGVEPSSTATIQKLLDRIDSLERRIANLEKSESRIRLADRREEQDIDPDSSGLSQFVPAPAIGNPDQNQRELNETRSDRHKHTNGQTWSFRLLNHKK